MQKTLAALSIAVGPARPSLSSKDIQMRRVGCLLYNPIEGVRLFGVVAFGAVK